MSFFTVLEALLRSTKRRRGTSTTWTAKVGGAPSHLHGILRALDEHEPAYADFGQREIRCNAWVSFETALSNARIDTKSENYFDSHRSVLLGWTAGGDAAFGIAWDDKRAWCVEVDVEFAHRRIWRFTPEEFVEHLDAKERESASIAGSKPTKTLVDFVRDARART